MNASVNNVDKYGDRLIHVRRVYYEISHREIRKLTQDKVKSFFHQ